VDLRERKNGCDLQSKRQGQTTIRCREEADLTGQCSLFRSRVRGEQPTTCDFIVNLAAKALLLGAPVRRPHVSPGLDLF